MRDNLGANAIQLNRVELENRRLRPQPPGFYLWWLIAFGHRQTLRFCIQIKVLWPGTHKHKGLDSLVPFTCEKPAYRVLYLITLKFDVNTMYVLSYFL